MSAEKFSHQLLLHDHASHLSGPNFLGCYLRARTGLIASPSFSNVCCRSMRAVFVELSSTSKTQRASDNVQISSPILSLIQHLVRLVVPRKEAHG